MKFIGITGGVGAGKSAILSHLAKKPDTRVMLADEIAHELMEQGTDCYHAIQQTFGNEDIFLPGGGLDRGKLAAVIFADPAKRQQMNDIVHPAVKEYVKRQAAKERERGTLKLLVLEAALLIEEHYDEICDELWYIDTKEEIRRERLKKNRGYSEEKISDIISKQLSETEFKKHCRVILDNNGEKEDVYRQIDTKMGGI